MAIIVVTTSGQTVQVKNGDKVVVDIPGGGTVDIVAFPGANVKNFKVEFADNDSQADTVNIDLSTFSTYDLHIDIWDYDSSDTVNLISAFNTHVDPGNTDEFAFQYIGLNGVQYNGFVRAKDKGEKDFTANPPPIIICFAQGTKIHTDLGPIPVESLKVGDRVETRDNGMQPLRWIGRRVVDSLTLARNPHLLPISFSSGSLGQDLPFTDLTVSPQHRICFEGWQAELNFGASEILVPALSFVNGSSVTRQENLQPVTYFHLLFERHEIITANGVASESLYLGDMVIGPEHSAARAELAQLFPDAPSWPAAKTTARRVARPSEAPAILVA